MSDLSALPPPVIKSRRVRKVQSEDAGLRIVPEVLQAEIEKSDAHEARAELVPVDTRYHLGYISTIALIINKIIGTGIYSSPSAVLAATNSKGISLMLWIAGCVITWAGLFIYLEYGIRWPVTGGELYYIDKVWTKPSFRFWTYLFASMFIIVNGVQANALTFGKQIILATSDPNTPINTSLQKLFAVLMITFVCQLQAYSRFIYIRISNMLAVFKVSLLIFVVLCGMVALAGVRTKGPNTIETPYGTQNLTDVFSQPRQDLYDYSLALLNVMRAFLGYENANFVLTEVKTGPSGDERRTFRRAVKWAVGIVSFLYIMTNVAFFAACTNDEIIHASNTLGTFLEKVFGSSRSTEVISAAFVCISAVGATMALTFANVRVKQEIARMGIIPIPEFWCKTSHRRTPARALFLHWIFSVICIAVTPLETSDGFLIMSTFYSYIHTYISVMLGVALLCAPWLACFKYMDRDDPHWSPQSTSYGFWLLGPLIAIYVSANAFVLVVSWWPVDLQRLLKTEVTTLPYYTGPVAALAIFGFGALWWLWDVYILPMLGYHFQTEEHTYYSDVWRINTLRVNFYRRLDGPAKRLYNFLGPAIIWCGRWISGSND